MTQDKVSALLGRPLSSIETTNFSTYLEIAQSRISDMFCVDICQVVESKKFDARQGYQTLNVPIFTEIDFVKLDGEETEAYKVYQGSNRNGDWYNNIVFDEPLHCETVEIKADWGFSKIPVDVQVMIAQLFGMVGDSLENDLIQSKQVEDFRITFKNETKTNAFVQKYAATIAKYSGCTSGNIQVGNAPSGYYRGHLYSI